MRLRWVRADGAVGEGDTAFVGGLQYAGFDGRRSQEAMGISGVGTVSRPGFPPIQR